MVESKKKPDENGIDLFNGEVGLIVDDCMTEFKYK